MAGTPEATIRKAAKAYINGDPQKLQRHLHPGVRIHGSHRRDDWSGSGKAVAELAAELAQHAQATTKPSGTLVDHALDPIGVQVSESGDMAWWSARGGLTVGGDVIDDASWTTVLRLNTRDCSWSIVHSHFSIHR